MLQREPRGIRISFRVFVKRKGLIAMAKKNGSLKLKIAACKKCKSQPRLKLGLSFYFECNCGQSISGAYGDGILETTRKWNEAQREDKNV